MSKFKYNPGDKIGPNKTLLLERLPEYKPVKGKFICSYCGKEFTARITHVGQGLIISCGCAHTTKCQNDLKNKRFGKLVVISDTGKRAKDGRIIWHCECDCGNYKDVSSKYLINNNTLSCGCLHSKGEQIVQRVLDDMSISYVQEKTFNNCINPITGTKLRFDFYLLDHNTCIEYDGEQHFFESGGYYTNNFVKNVKERDSIKNQYRKNNNIKLIRIPYWDYNKITVQYMMELLNE